MLNRGEVWFAYVGALSRMTRTGTRPVCIVSSNIVNHSTLPTLLVVPFTPAETAAPAEVFVLPPEGGLRQPSVALCEHVCPIRRVQLIRRMGQLSARTMAQISMTLRGLLDI